MTYFLPRYFDIRLLRKTRTDRQPEEINIVDLRRYQVDHPIPVNPFQQLLVEFVAALQPEAHQPHDYLGRYFEAIVGQHERFEIMSQIDVLPDERLQVLHAVQPQHEPQLQGPEAASQWNLPVAVVRHTAVLVVPQVQGIDVEGVHQPRGIFQPHGRAVEVDQHPLVGIEVEGVSSFYALHQVSEFRADEGRTRVGGVHVEPNVLLVADDADFVESVESAG